MSVLAAEHVQAAPTTVRLGTRGSLLARWQTDYVIALLQKAWPDTAFETVVMTTKGDRIIDTPLPLIGGKGLFTLELEEALRSGDIDIAVHSLKDLPTESPTGLRIGAIPERANPADVLVSRNGQTLEMLPEGATVGTSSKRRAAQLLHARPDLQIRDIRGNVDTRVRKVLDEDGPYDATILAYAGLIRLDKLDIVTQVLPFDVMLPAPGQGALGIQCRDDEAAAHLLTPARHDAPTASATAERAFLAALEGGCSTPVAALATIEDGILTLHGRVTAPDGSIQVDVVVDGAPEDAAALGISAAQQAFMQGAHGILQTA